MDRKYKGWSMQEREREYARLKTEWTQTNAYDEKSYNAFVERIARELGV